MAAADDPIRIDPEIVNEHHEATLTKLNGAGWTRRMGRAESATTVIVTVIRCLTS